MEGKMAEKSFALTELYEAWPVLSIDERVEGFELLHRDDAEELFLRLSPRDQVQLILALPPAERRLWIRLLAPDEAVDVIQEAPGATREGLLSLLDDKTRGEVKGLLDYAEDQAGGLMNTRYARLRPHMSVDEAVSFLRRDARDRAQTVYYAYVVDSEERLLGVVSFRDLLTTPGDKTIQEVMRSDVITAPEHLDQEALSHLFARHNLQMIPVVDAEKHIKGVVTLDDIIDVGEMFTATAMGYYEAEIARAVVLALFVPLIISSGGNSGSQASTLVIRAMALREVRLRDWWRVIRRELATGLTLGSILAAIGLGRILLWQILFQSYGDHYFLVALTVALSLIGVIMWGTIAGSTLPFILRMLGFDPASASAPFVATLVDVTGLIIYFTVAEMVLRGTLL
ncbi:MAG: magnesium transporter [Deltaproteobacteria bacterium]|nr:magnesium transporter [Deltaproteobacteria bacterium]